MIASCCVIFAAESVLNNPSYRWLLQFDNWSISSACLHFILNTGLLLHCQIEKWRENRRKKREIEETKHVKQYEKIYWAEDRITESDEEFLWPWEEDHAVELQEDRLSYYHKTLWLLQSIAGHSILVVTVCYVILEDHIKAKVLATYLSLSVFLLADAILSFTPIRLLHFVYSYLFTLLYVLVIAVYYFAKRTHQISALPSFVNRIIQDPFQAMLVILVLIIGQPLFQTLYFCVHKLNTFIYIKCYSY